MPRDPVERTRRDLYLTQRAIGDAQALRRRGRLPRRLGRRAVTRAILRALWGQPRHRRR